MGGPAENMCILNCKTKFHVLNVPMISPQTVAYIHALIIDSISISCQDSINSQQLQHESAMSDVYTKMTPDSFKTQLQAVLTTYYEDIKGIQGARGCPMPKFVMRRFEDPQNAEPTPEDCAALPTLDLAAAPAAVATEAPPPGTLLVDDNGSSIVSQHK
jgi:hypothetical protein